MALLGSSGLRRWIDHPYRLRLPTGHVSVAEPYGIRVRGEKANWINQYEDEVRSELDSLAKYGWSYVISADQALHWTRNTVSVQLYPRGVRAVNLREFWRSAIGINAKR